MHMKTVEKANPPGPSFSPGRAGFLGQRAEIGRLLGLARRT